MLDPTMFDHAGFAVRDFVDAKAVFARALAPLEIALLIEVTADTTGASSHIGFAAIVR